MQIYREQRRTEDARLLLAELRTRVERLDPTCSDAHDRVVRVLIDVGILEAAVADALYPDADGLDPLTGALRAASVASGHLLWLSWLGRVPDMAPWVHRLLGVLGTARKIGVPARVDTRVPEGYAYYGVYPETYLEAARAAYRTLDLRRLVCVGLRSIGTSLSGAVAGALEALGCEVVSTTLRPHGHPFDRRPVFSEAMRALLSDARADHFLLVDEGPGLSGSSLAGAARALEHIGVPGERIVLFPSWRTDGRRLSSADARERWGRHPQFTTGFEEVWMSTGRLCAVSRGATFTDFSAGAWRPMLLDGPGRYPAVQPQHERRKYLAQGGALDGGAPVLFCFAGLGVHGEPKLERARRLAEAGFCPLPITLEHGFLVRRFVAGVPLDAPIVDDPLLCTMADYLAFLRRACPAPLSSRENLADMTLNNVTQGLGPVPFEQLALRLRQLDAEQGEAPTLLDGRMLPHEWVRTGSGYLKTDALHHGDGHFYPGPHDIAWDVAGTCIEFDLGREARQRLVSRYRSASGDRSIASRLPAFGLAYLAFRLGYAAMAAESLEAETDGPRFRRLAARYRSQLARDLSSPLATWDV